VRIIISNNKNGDEKMTGKIEKKFKSNYYKKQLQNEKAKLALLGLYR
jgi:hypothetical protein